MKNSVLKMITRKAAKRNLLLMLVWMMAGNAFAQEVIVPPDGLLQEAKQYVMTYDDLDGAPLSKEVTMAVDGNDVYLQGMSDYFPEAWVKGTQDGLQVTFPAKQYMGKRGTYGVSYFFSNGETIFAYDAIKDTYSTEEIVYGLLGEVEYDGYYTHPLLQQVEEKAATPATPEIKAVTTDVYGWYISFVISPMDTEENVMMPTKLSYQVFTDVEHEISPLVFTPVTHIKLGEEMSVVPYRFKDGFDFYDTKVYLNTLYSEDWNKIGIQSIYSGGGEEHKSEICWFTLKDYKPDVDPYPDPEPGPGEEDVPDAKTADLPYANDFSTAEKLSDLMVLDANDDGNTWLFGSGVAFYSYSSTKAADDWIVSPQVPLETGKKYHISVKAHAESSYYYEKMEVRAAKKATSYSHYTAELLKNGLEVIPVTKITNITLQTYENTSFTVEEDGYYNIGIHVVTPAYMWILTVDDLLIEEVDTTGIHDMMATVPKDTNIYNLNGQRMDHAAPKGLCIVNGKLVLMK